jgi:hypothetical protein
MNRRQTLEVSTKGKFGDWRLRFACAAVVVSHGQAAASTGQNLFFRPSGIDQSARYAPPACSAACGWAILLGASQEAGAEHVDKLFARLGQLLTPF